MSMNTSTDATEKQDEDALLNAENLTKTFPVGQSLIDRLLSDQRRVHAVDGISLSLDRKETIGIVGESGCGKSTLGRTLARLYEPTGGRIHFDGKDITNLSGQRLRQLRKEVQVIFQDPLSSLNPRKTAGEIVERPLEIHEIGSGEEREAHVARLFEEVGLNPQYAERYPHELSGGQQQRIGIARALAVEPKLIIADEPVSALDVSVQAQIINLMKRLQEEYDLSYLFIAHDLSVVKHVSDRIGVMYLGKIVEEGPTEAIFKNPHHPYTRSLLNAIPRVDEDAHGRTVVLEGNPPSPIDLPSGCRFHTRCPEFIGDECERTEPELATVDQENATTNSDATHLDEVDVEDVGTHRSACHWIHKSSDKRREQDPYVNGDT